MIFNQPDYLRPIRDANRDEYLLIEFHRVFKNTNMSLLRNLFLAAKDDKEILRLLPNLVAYTKLDVDHQYYATVMYNYPEDLVMNLSGDTFTPALCKAYVTQFGTPYHFEYLHLTRIESILSALMKKEFVKKIYLFADNFTTEMLAYISTYLGNEGVDPRVVAIEGNFVDCLSSKPEITTCFISNASDIIQVLETEPSLLHQKFIMVSDGYGNYIPNEKEESFDYAYLDRFDDLKEKKEAVIAYAYPYCIEKAI